MLSKEIAQALGEQPGATMDGERYTRKFLDYCISKDLFDRKSPEILLLFHDEALFRLFGTQILRSNTILEVSLQRKVIRQAQEAHQ